MSSYSKDHAIALFYVSSQLRSLSFDPSHCYIVLLSKNLQMLTLLDLGALTCSLDDESTKPLKNLLVKKPISYISK